MSELTTTKRVPPRKRKPPIVSGWALSLLLHGGIFALLALSPVAIDLATFGGPAPVSDARGNQIAFYAQPEPEQPHDVEKVLEVEVPPEEAFPEPVPEEIPPEVVATEFADDDVIPTSLHKADGLPSDGGGNGDVFVSVSFENVKFHSNLNAAAATAPAVADASVNPGGSSGPGVIGVGGAVGDGSGTGTGNGSGTGVGDGVGSGSGVGGRGGSGVGNGTGNGIGNGKGDGIQAGTGARPPKPKKMERGPYPSDARRAGQEGTVTLRIDVAASGKVSAVEVASSCGYASLDRAAREAAERWTFYPAEVDGHAIAARVEVRYGFRLVDHQ